MTESPKPNVQRPRSSVVVPQPLKWHQQLLASLIYGFIRVVGSTLRYQWEYHRDILQPENGPFIFCIWHNRLALSLVMYDDYIRRQQQPYRLAAIVSASKDGGVVARILEHFGTQPVRGSSSRRGPQALRELTTWVERGYDVAITPDGPRGPRYVVQDGVIALAQLTGRPIIPASQHLSWKIRLKSWDRFQVPLPFGKAVMKFGEPLVVPRGIQDTERERLRQELEERIKNLTID
jgi:hypothetical protein